MFVFVVGHVKTRFKASGVKFLGICMSVKTAHCILYDPACVWKEQFGVCETTLDTAMSSRHKPYCFFLFAFPAQNVTVDDILSSYKQACHKLNCKPIPKVLKQIQVRPKPSIPNIHAHTHSVDKTHCETTPMNSHWDTCHMPH